ncbi:leukocyte immunoglobulin-like receptor subfamily A member 5 [Psammomys obesus]|uniref:leukocyte immunoglobulin-like receptor subfamily A member 5 n=1 Tax=Psammomys obesus TaxID=48139 RepID=UPI002452ACD5|nr:leukocyte immunoglobulin-like receptor subfamily A member 5 [Psammomys obesus]
MSLDPAADFLAGALSKPTIRMVPSNVVTSGNQVTIFCEGSLHAQEYCLYKEGSKDYWMPTTPLKTENKARFYISSIQWAHSGRYWCSYKSLINMSEWKSDIMELVVTGVYRGKVTLSAIPKYVVISGEHVTLQCFSKVAYDRFILMKEDEKLSMAVPARKRYTGRFQAMFTVGPVTPNQRWRFTCYGYYLSNSQIWSLPSNHLDLLVPESKDQSSTTTENATELGHKSCIVTYNIGDLCYVNYTPVDSHTPKSIQAAFINEFARDNYKHMEGAYRLKDILVYKCSLCPYYVF